MAHYIERKVFIRELKASREAGGYEVDKPRMQGIRREEAAVGNERG